MWIISPSQEVSNLFAATRSNVVFAYLTLSFDLPLGKTFVCQQGASKALELAKQISAKESLEEMEEATRMPSGLCL